MSQLVVEDITVVILAGGKGRRMGGRDKGLLSYHQQALIKHVIDGISRQTNNIVINANRSHDEYASFGYPIVQDTLADFQGPLAGFIAAMSTVKTDAILTLPCDGPHIAGNYLQKMLDSMNQSGCEIAIASDGKRLQPVYALIPVRLKQSLQGFIAQGDRKIDYWYKLHDCCLVDFSTEQDMFTNINTPEDLNSLPE